jgi:hypothetical protein
MGSSVEPDRRQVLTVPESVTTWMDQKTDDKDERIAKPPLELRRQVQQPKLPRRVNVDAPQRVRHESR